jgi:hypothetical protein
VWFLRSHGQLSFPSPTSHYSYHQYIFIITFQVEKTSTLVLDLSNTVNILSLFRLNKLQHYYLLHPVYLKYYLCSHSSFFITSCSQPCNVSIGFYLIEL